MLGVLGHKKGVRASESLCVWGTTMGKKDGYSFGKGGAKLRVCMGVHGDGCRGSCSCSRWCMHVTTLLPKNEADMSNSSLYKFDIRF
jgi:hypothetical protein